MPMFYLIFKSQMNLVSILFLKNKSSNFTLFCNIKRDFYLDVYTIFSRI